MTAFDFLIVGAGLFGAVCARELAEAGQRVLVIEREPYVGGMARDEMRDGQRVSLHGGHIYHTRDRRLWDYVNRFAEFVPVYPKVRAMARGELYSFPLNLATFQQAFGVVTPDEARNILRTVRQASAPATDSVESWCLANIGQYLYELFIEGYTAKQWGRPASQVPASVVRRLPIRFTWDGGYFDHPWQGVPVNGFTGLIESLLAHKNIEVGLGEDFLGQLDIWQTLGCRVIYTGPLDALLGYELGRLEYRSLRWEWETMPVPDYQGCAAVNFCDADVPYTRVIEFKHFWPAATPHSLIVREYPAATGPAYYPVGDDANRALHARYVDLAAERYPMLVPGGRLGGYLYLDMHQAVASAQALVARELAQLKEAV